MDPVTILDKAIDILETEGWRTGALHRTSGETPMPEDLESNEGPHCMMGAIEKAAGLKPWSSGLSYAPHGAPQEVHRVVGALNAETKRIDERRIWSFNDTRDSVDDVIDVLRHTKKAFENGEVQ